jgi:hypothetical protein
MPTRFAIDEPLSRMPPPLSGSPHQSLIQSVTSNSVSAAPGEPIHMPEKMLNPDASASAIAPT